MKPERAHLGRPLTLATLVFAGGVLLHVDRLPLWCTIVALGCAGWRWLASRRPVRLPGRTLRIVIAIALSATVLATYRTLNGLAAGTALLVVMGAVKMLETRTRRDQLIVVYASLFLLLAACLDRQELLRAPLYAALAWLACIALVHIAHPTVRLSPRESAALAGRSLAMALPLALLLFVFFPRIPGAFWALPKSGQALTGLSDTMSPGSITELTDSDAPAFRVWFDGPPPAPQLRYWRGPVLHDFDGYTWRRGRQLAPQPAIDYLGEPVSYRLTLEPHAQHWWFALDLPAGPPQPRVRFTWDYQLLAPQPVSEPVTYNAVSYTRVRNPAALSITGRRIDTRLPEGRNERTRALGERLRQSSPAHAAVAQAGLDLFRNGGFEYTLTPPRLDLDSVDDFIFNTRRGFCGHFASAYVTLMRAAGVPARVVTGYLGGEWNPIGGYFIVRQSDAHAWAEVWLEGRGWTRVDPTAVVAPERLTRGLFDVLPDAGSAQSRLVRDSLLLTRSRLAWDALNAWWGERVVGFNLRAQLDILDRLGFESPGWRHLGAALAAALLLWLLWIALHLSRMPRPPALDPLGRAYARLCGKLARAGMPRADHEGPIAYAERVRAERAQLAARVIPLLEQYASLRYGRTPRERTRREAASFARQVARLRLGHRRSA